MGNVPEYKYCDAKSAFLKAKSERLPEMAISARAFAEWRDVREPWSYARVATRLAFLRWLNRGQVQPVFVMNLAPLSL
jgi:hypothetical protein